MNRSTAFCCVVLACAGCSRQIVIQTSAITPAGGGNYLVVSKPSDNTDWSDLRIRALTAANTYCTGQGKEMEQVHTDTNGTSGWGEQSLELTFRCAMK